MEYKTLRVTKEVYDKLDKKLVHRETFSHLIKRLLDLHDTMTDVSGTLGPNHYLKGPHPSNKTYAELMHDKL